MDRDEAAGAARSNGHHPSHQLYVTQEGRRPLFSAAGAQGENSRQDGPARPSTAQFGPHGADAGASDRFGFGRRMRSDPSAALSERRSSYGSWSSPNSSRIPRPSSENSTRYRPLTLTEAYRMAEAEEMQLSDGNMPADGSPSPAPRPLRARNASDEARIRNFLSEDHLDSKGQNRLSPNAQQRRVESRKNLDQRRMSPLSQFKAGTRSEEAGRQLSNVTGNEGAARQGPADWGNKSRASAEGPMRSDASNVDAHAQTKLPDLVPGIEDGPFSSIEARREASSRPSFLNESPGKPYTWQVDEDFTAGDLQVSDSPRIKVSNEPFAKRPSLLDDNTWGRRYQLGTRGNTKLDEIRAREQDLGMATDVPVQPPRPRVRNTKLDEILARELQAEYEIPIPERNPPRPKNTKLDEIRQREIDGMSKRAVAAAKLEEIREQNSMSRSLSVSPDSRPRASRASERESISAVNRATRLPVRPRSAFETGGERIPDTPVTIFKNRQVVRVEEEDALAGPNLGSQGRAGDASSAQTEAAHTRGDSRELLRRLARAASSSPAHEPTDARKSPSPAKAEKNTDDKPSSSRLTSGRPANNGRRATSREDRENQSTRPTVGFTGLRRTRSTESTKSKRSSMHSETDPTDRIEAEMKLFAPMDNYSERGSVRAPSPLPDSDDEEEKKMTEATPRAQKQDPLTMPTPRVTGAYVETPITIKVEKIEDLEDKPPSDKQVRSEAPTISQDKKRELARRSKDQDTASDPGSEEKGELLAASATARRKPRANSLPRRRPPLKNSAKPHSVKDDLLELQRAHNIDDSTLDDLEEILTGRKTSLPELDALLKDLPGRSSEKELEPEPKPKTKPEPYTAEDGQKKSTVKDAKKEKSASDGELAAYDRMTRTLRTGLLGIRSAKQGIARLEDQFSTSESKSSTKPEAKPDTKPETKSSTKPSTETAKEKQHEHKHHHHVHQSQCPECIARPNPIAVAYIHLPIPRLFHRTPQFRFTLLGLVLFIMGAWYAIEMGMCQMYCRPTACTTPPCVWSFDDPTFGVALPVKLDQWTTGGYGRTLATDALEEVRDWVADMQDLVYGRKITDVMVEALSFEQKRQHRRRLSKKGLLQGLPPPPPEERAKWDAWRRTRRARERAREEREMGYGPRSDDDEGVIGRDERLW